MNWLTKLILGLIILLPDISLGQEARIVDLKVRILSPFIGSFIKSPGTVTIFFSIINKGPGKFKPIDTIFYYPQTNDTFFKSRRIFCSKILHAGDSEIFNINLPFNSSYDNDHYSLGISNLSAYNRSSDSLRREPINCQKDNSNFITVKHRSASSKIKGINISTPITIYPNPVNESFRIDCYMQHQMANFVLFSINGIKIKEFKLNDFSRNIIFQTDDVPNGNYFLKYTTNSISFYSKITVLH